MYDQSFNERTLGRVFCRGDFFGIPKADVDSFKSESIDQAIGITSSDFSALSFLKSSHAGGRNVVSPSSIPAELIIRKVTKNINWATHVRSNNRDRIVACLCDLLSEGVPYKVYRLDIRKFYPSVAGHEIFNRIDSVGRISPLTQSLLRKILEEFWGSGGTGIPIGLPLSAPLSELVLREFDRNARTFDGVFFYGRYVDDIVVIGDTEINDKLFFKHISKALPDGLVLHDGRKRQVKEISSPVKSTKVKRTKDKISFSYLGYEFSVFDPYKKDVAGNKSPYRALRVELSEDKLSKYTTRISRAMVEFNKYGDFGLLFDRVRFLTKNFSITDRKTGVRRSAGIYFGYRSLSPESVSLLKLDGFLRRAVLRGVRPVGGTHAHLLSQSQKRILLSASFSRGFRKKEMINFSSSRMAEIQGCWKNV